MQLKIKAMISLKKEAKILQLDMKRTGQTSLIISKRDYSNLKLRIHLIMMGMGN